MPTEKDIDPHQVLGAQSYISSPASAPALSAAGKLAYALGDGSPEEAGLAGPVTAVSPTKRPKILLVSVFHPELLRGGAQQICYELFQGLKERDDADVTLLASVDESFPALFKTGARITGFDRRKDEFLWLARDYNHTWHKLSEPLMIEAFIDFLRLIQPDVIHFHHFFTFGIDILTIARRTLPEARIVLTFHEFLAICDAYGQMVRRFDNSLCASASSVRCHQCFPDRTPEHYFLREMWMKKHLAAVDLFTTPTKFMIEHYVNWGLAREKIVCVPNGQQNYNAPPKPDAPRAVRNRFGFFGQMVDNKGIHILFEAVELLRSEGFTNFAVEINGDNLKYASEARRKQIEAFLEQERLRTPKEQNVIYNGSYHTDELHRRMLRVDWCIVPSIWWEIFGLVISEAWMFKRPVIASNVGGMAERITHEVNGLLFDVADARSLARTMRRACEEEGLWGRLTAGIVPPPRRDEMVDRFCQLYGLPDRIARSPDGWATN